MLCTVINLRHDIAFSMLTYVILAAFAEHNKTHFELLQEQHCRLKWLWLSGARRGLFWNIRYVLL